MCPILNRPKKGWHKIMPTYKATELDRLKSEPNCNVQKIVSNKESRTKKDVTKRDKYGKSAIKIRGG